jgi:hypothetical protein
MQENKIVSSKKWPRPDECIFLLTNLRTNYILREHEKECQNTHSFREKS